LENVNGDKKTVIIRKWMDFEESGLESSKVVLYKEREILKKELHGTTTPKSQISKIYSSSSVLRGKRLP
jgi:hypothetical protein